MSEVIPVEQVSLECETTVRTPNYFLRRLWVGGTLAAVIGGLGMGAGWFIRGKADQAEHNMAARRARTAVALARQDFDLSRIYIEAQRDGDIIARVFSPGVGQNCSVDFVVESDVFEVDDLSTAHVKLFRPELEPTDGRTSGVVGYSGVRARNGDELQAIMDQTCAAFEDSFVYANPLDD